MPYSGIQPLIQTLKVYTAYEDKEIYRQITPIAITSFITLYSFLLITDGYYFIIFLVMGVGLGTFFSYNKTSNFKFTTYERNLSYTEQTLEQVKTL